MTKQLYHTQEHRKDTLTQPQKCISETAWLGEAYYYWHDLFEAEQWGHNSKRRTGQFEVYKSDIEFENVLDTVFNEEQYFFWLNQIEKVAKKIIKNTNEKPTIKELNDYLKEKGTWYEVKGILFQDLPANNDFLLVKPIEYQNKKIPFAYKKRIQLAVYNIEIIVSFVLLSVNECN